jgi:hypothetical protein
MMGPALLIGLFFSGLSGYLRADPGFELLSAVIGALVWPLTALAIFWAGRLLTRKGRFTRTLRALGFAHIVYVIEFLTFIPPVAPLAIFLTNIVAFLAAWMAAAEAHETRGWRTLILPLVGLLIIVAVPLALVAMMGGAVIGLQSILERLGLAQP